MTRLMSSVVLVASLWASQVMAWPVVQDACFLLDPFVDVVRLIVKQPAADEQFFAVLVEWHGADVYLLEGGGIAYGPGGVVGFSAEVSHDTPYFGGNALCTLKISTLPIGPQGQWRYAFHCDSGGVPYGQSGWFVLTTCDSLDSPQARIGGQLAGE